jgi:hypothetical protein
MLRAIINIKNINGYVVITGWRVPVEGYMRNKLSYKVEQEGLGVATSSHTIKTLTY